MRAWLSGKASPSQGEDRGFDPRRPLQMFEVPIDSSPCPQVQSSI